MAEHHLRPASLARPPSATTPTPREPLGEVPSTGGTEAPVSNGGPDTAGDGDVCPSPPCSPTGRLVGDGQVPLLGPEMVPPRLLFGPEPRYTAEAALEHVGGTVLVRCTVTDRGTVEDCLVMKSLPLLDASVLRAVAERRYQPALFEGRPLSVRMVIPVRFVPP
jgi:TonB family protein